MIRNFAPLILACATLSGCSTAIKYTPWQEDGPPVASTSLKFALQDSSVVFAAPAEKKENDPSKEGGDVKGTSKKCGEAQWWKCFDGVSTAAVMAPPDFTKSPIYVASAQDGHHLYFSTTSITGTPVAGQDILHSQVTIKYTNNTSTIAAGAAAGATSGAVFGPAGIVAGGILGGAGAAPVPWSTLMTPRFAWDLELNELSFRDYLCAPYKLQAKKFKQLSPRVYLPLTIDAQAGFPLSATQDVLPRSEGRDACWHLLPNSRFLGEAEVAVVGAKPSERTSPIDGDGWLYRFVAATPPSEKPPGAQMRSTEYFKPENNPHQDFPYSSCRKIEIQVVWWEELEDAIDTWEKNKTTADKPNFPMPRILAFKSVVADPSYVSIAPVAHGGVVNFKPGCGATVSTTTDYSGTASLGAMVTAAGKIREAQDKAK